MATPKTLVEQAKAGDVAAIAKLMNHSLKKGVLNGQPAKVQVRQRGDEYRLLVVSEQVLDKSTTVKWIGQGLKKLAVPNLSVVTIYGRSQQSAQPDWQCRIQMNKRPNAAITENSDGLSESSKPSQLEPTSADAPASTSTVLSEAAIDLSEYCFTRNKGLLSGELNPPAKVVSQLVIAFATLPNAQKLLLMPHLSQVLRKPAPVEDDSLSPQSNSWLEQVTALEGNDLRRFSIWISRYCQHPAETLGQLSPHAGVSRDTAKASSAVQEASPQAEASASITVTEDAGGNAIYDLGYQPSRSVGGNLSGAGDRTQSNQGTSSGTQVVSHKPEKTPPVLKWSIPLVWSVCLALLVMIGVGSASPVGMAAANNSYNICQATTGSQEACTLAVQMTGDEAWFNETLVQATPIPPDDQAIALEWCSEYVNYEAGLLSETVSTAPAVLSSQSEEIFPGMLLTSVTQKSQVNPGETLRVACLNSGYAYTAEDGVPAEYVGTVELEELAVEFIPVNWPSEPYVGSMASFATLTDVLGFYEPLIHLFAYPLFTAVGLFFAVLFSPCYSSRSALGIYKMAAILGALNLFTFSLPLGGRLIILVEVLAIGLASRVVREFEVVWQGGRVGYGLLAFGAGTVIVVRWILASLLTMFLYSATNTELLPGLLASM